MLPPVHTGCPLSSSIRPATFSALMAFARSPWMSPTARRNTAHGEFSFPALTTVEVDAFDVCRRNFVLHHFGRYTRSVHAEGSAREGETMEVGLQRRGHGQTRQHQQLCDRRVTQQHAGADATGGHSDSKTHWRRPAPAP